MWLAQEDVARIAEFLDVPQDKFRRLFCRDVKGRISLIERANYDCIFLTAEGCRIYPVRPHQCRTFPFWPHLVRSKRRWKSVKQRCPGVGKGKVYTEEEIKAILAGVRPT